MTEVLKTIYVPPNNENMLSFMESENQKLDMTEEQWEAICKRCGKCCYYKYLIEETDELEYGEVCEFLDEKTRLCTCYNTRSIEKPDCLKLSPENLEENAWWLPEDCAYRQLVDNPEKPETK